MLYIACTDAKKKILCMPLYICESFDTLLIVLGVLTDIKYV